MGRVEECSQREEAFVWKGASRFDTPLLGDVVNALNSCVRWNCLTISMRSAIKMVLASIQSIVMWLADGCSSHLTAVATGALMQFLRYLILCELSDTCGIHLPEPNYLLFPHLLPYEPQYG